MIITDLDGTLLDNNEQVSNENIDTLHEIGTKNIKRIVATGRNLFSLKKVIHNDFPIDYAIFSTGAGIINWKTKKIIFKRTLSAETVAKICNHLHSQDINFAIHHPIPENHLFDYFASTKPHPDFIKRLEIYEGFTKPITLNSSFRTACEVLAIIENNPELFSKLAAEISEAQVIRATSPLDKNSIWVEYFAPNTTKGTATHWLCKKLGIEKNQTIGMGNDYNDEGLLDYTEHSFVVNNAPDDLKKKHKTCAANTENALADVVKKFL